MARFGASRGGLIVVLAAAATVALAWVLQRPAVDRREPVARPEAGEPATTDVATRPEGEVAPDAAVTPAGETLPVWETRDGTLHIGDDPPPESQALGTVTARDAHVLESARAEVGEAKTTGDDVEELLRRMRKDTARRSLAGVEGDPTWSIRDIEGVVASGDALDVATNWITNPTMIRVARRLCRYVSAQGDTYEPSTVVVRGRHGRILARCKAIG
jgi:hypothetical protein